MKILTLIYSLVFFAISSLPALADGGGGLGGNPLPEPGALSLLAIGVGAAALIKYRGRNKK